MVVGRSAAAGFSASGLGAGAAATGWLAAGFLAGPLFLLVDHWAAAGTASTTANAATIACFQFFIANLLQDSYEPAESKRICFNLYKSAL